MTFYFRLSHSETASPNSANVRILSEFVWYSAPQLQEYITKHGVQVRVIDDESLVAIGNHVGEVIAGIIDRDKNAREVYASMMKAREWQMPYTKQTTGEYLRARTLPFKLPKV